MRIRRLQSPDLAAVVALEANLHTTAWTARQFEESLAAGHLLWVVEQNAQIIGYAVASTVLDEAELLTLGVCPSQQGQGLGRALLERLIDDLARRDVRRLFLEVRAGNLSAQALYRRLGFAAIGRRKAYYAAVASPSGREDALTMAKEW